MVHDHLSSRLKDKVQILTLVKSEAAESYTWSPLASRWAAVEYDTSQNLFSRIGIGTRGVHVVLRMQPLTLHQALCWRDKHLFLTAIRDHDSEYLELEAALVTVENCTAVRTEDTVGEGNRPVTAEAMRIAFPAVLTEKYIRYEREDTHDETEQTYVLVTPKAILLQSGDLVTVQAGSAKGTYYVTAPHILDEYKNEYEIVRRGDV